FGAMLEAVKLEVIKTLNTVEIRAADEVPQIDDKAHVENVRLQHADYDDALAGDAASPAPGDAKGPGAAAPSAQPMVRQTIKVGRNEPCPCGSGKKFKHCHGKLS